MTPRTVTGADLELAMYEALKAHDMKGVGAILRAMAVVDPRRAQDLYDLLRLGLDLARAGR